MATPVHTDTPSAVATSAGVITAVAGSALLFAPGGSGALIGLTTRRDARIVAAVDLTLAPGMLFGRPQWPWLAARAVSNPPTASFVLRRAGIGASRRRARVFAAILAVATVNDFRAFYALRRHHPASADQRRQQ
jgi:hypothetical protein